MRLTKTAYLFGEDKLLLDENGNPVKDPLGRPVVVPGKPDIPFPMEWEPYSTELAKTQYGTFVEGINYRMFTYPDERLTLGTEFLYKDNTYQIREVKDFDRHYEILVQLM
jgi:hypothetical protein